MYLQQFALPITEGNNTKIPPKKQVGVRGKIYTSQSREIIANVLKFMKEEASKGAPIIPVTNFKQRVLQATGISERIYRQVQKDLELLESGEIESFREPVRQKRIKEVEEVRVSSGDFVKDEVEIVYIN